MPSRQSGPAAMQETPFFKPGKNCWQVAQADAASLLIDGENYFRAIRHAMRNAYERIVLIGWDFDARVKIYDTQAETEGPLEIGEYVDWLVKQNPRLNIHILQWDVGAIKLAKRGKTLMKVASWLPHPRVHFALDGAHPAGAAQHEKLIVIDRHTAFCGGIDITEDRWDTRNHRDQEEKRKQPGDHDTGPWHDASAQLTGDVAQALCDLAEQRWRDATGEELPEISSAGKTQLPKHDDQRGASLTLPDVPVAIARTRGGKEDALPVGEIEALYCDIIATARRTIYIENQYFTSKVIAHALAQRLREDGGPEIVLIAPATADGWLENQVMDSRRSRLIDALDGIDHEDRFRVYHPVTPGGADIYVHAKVMIIDDRFLRVGSSNLSNRSMGFDSECDLCVDAKQAASSVAAASQIEQIRNDLLAEHLGCEIETLAAQITKSNSLIGAIEALSRSGRRLRNYEHPDLNAVQEWLASNDILDPEIGDNDWPGMSLE